MRNMRSQEDSQPLNLTQLPAEILDLIVSYLDTKDLTRIMKTNKLFRDIVHKHIIVVNDYRVPFLVFSKSKKIEKTIAERRKVMRIKEYIEIVAGVLPGLAAATVGVLLLFVGARNNNDPMVFAGVIILFLGVTAGVIAGIKLMDKLASQIRNTQESINRLEIDRESLISAHKKNS